MRRQFILWALGALVVPAAAAQTSDAWKLVWSDEFDKDGKPDPAKWGYETGFVRNQDCSGINQRMRGAKEGC